MPKGYPVSFGYMGYVADEHRYVMFATEQEYVDYILDCTP